MSITAGHSSCCHRQKLHLFFLPFMAKGHIIPMLEAARAICSYGDASATFVTTPGNAHFFLPTIDHYNAALGLAMDLALVPFNGPEFGLPDGLESLGDVPPELIASFFAAVQALEGPIGELLQKRRPDCFVADVIMPWATGITRLYGIPSMAFQWSGLFSVSIMSELAWVYDQMPTACGDGMLVPHIPHQVYVSRSELPDAFHVPGFMKQIVRSEWSCQGTIVNSFRELEPGYAEHLQAQADSGRKVYCIGPVYLIEKPIDSPRQCESGNPASIAPLEWLDTKATDSVLYTCFGTLSKVTGQQLRELALGLEASGHSFLWVVDHHASGNKESWMPEGFEERVAREGKGLVVRSWVPQTEILNHRAVAGFLSHSGWNSTIESLTVGVPMATWPQAHEQFLNEKLVVEILRVGTPVREVRATLKKGGEDRHLVTAREIAEAVGKVMGGEEEAVGMRERAKACRENAVAAVSVGGSSVRDLCSLLKDMNAFRDTGVHEN